MTIEKINGINWYTRNENNSEYEIVLQKLKELKLFSRINKIKKNKNFILKIKLDKPLAYWGDELEVEFKNEKIVKTNLIDEEDKEKFSKDYSIYATRFFVYETLTKYDYKSIDIIGLEG